MRYLVGFTVFVLGVAVHAATPDRQMLMGSWQGHGSGDEKEVWTLAANGESLRITQLENERKISDLECNTLGRECEVKQAGKPVKVSMWFNGPRLVVMEVRGAEIVKRRFHTTDDGSAMEIETIPIVPQGKPEVLHLSRAPASR